ncbi:MAG: hypothetical protein IJV15_03380 [Lachnospiraceae bacterium]|nr:hypothetical protein [Lachnospiraceae bacterium]
MKLSVIAACFYIICMLAAVSGFYLYKKTDNKLYAGTWLPVTFLTLMGYQTFVAGIINLIHIPVNIISIGLFDLIPAVILWIFIIKNKQYQKYKYEWIDFVIWIIIILTVIVFAGKRYGSELLINYNSVDAAVHFGQARNVVNSQSVNGMYYSTLHNGLFLEAFGAFGGAGRLHRVYVLSDVMHLCLAGFMFWGLIRRWAKDNFLKMSGIIIVLMYLYGYPLNSTLFGFSYLGMGVTVIAYILALMDFYVDKDINRWFNIILMALGCYSIFQTYVLFMPVTFFAALICILIRQYKDKKLFGLDTIWVGLGVFLFATVFGFLYTYGGIFGSSQGGSGGVTVASAINIEGGVYEDLYSNFIFLIPVALVGIICLIKKDNGRLIIYLTILDVIFVFALLCEAVKHKVSAYYYYKNYYMLWLLAWVLFYIGLTYLEKNSRLVAAFTIILWLGMLSMSLLNIENRLRAKNELLSPQVNAEYLSHIYTFNYIFMNMRNYSPYKIDIYEYVNENLMNNEESYIPVVSGIDDYYWMQAITNQRSADFQYWNYGDDSFFDNLKKDNIHYIIVFNDNDFYRQHNSYFDGLKRIYENSMGYVAVIGE